MQKLWSAEYIPINAALLFDNVVMKSLTTSFVSIEDQLSSRDLPFIRDPIDLFCEKCIPPKINQQKRRLSYTRHAKTFDDNSHFHS